MKEAAATAAGHTDLHLEPTDTDPAGRSRPRPAGGYVNADAGTEYLRPIENPDIDHLSSPVDFRTTVKAHDADDHDGLEDIDCPSDDASPSMM